MNGLVFAGKPHISWENTDGFRLRFSQQNQSIDCDGVEWIYDQNPVKYREKYMAFKPLWIEKMMGLIERYIMYIIPQVV